MTFVVVWDVGRRVYRCFSLVSLWPRTTVMNLWTVLWLEFKYFARDKGIQILVDRLFFLCLRSSLLPQHRSLCVRRCNCCSFIAGQHSSGTGCWGVCSELRVHSNIFWRRWYLETLQKCKKYLLYKKISSGMGTVRGWRGDYWELHK